MTIGPLKHTTIPLARAWNTWDGERPAEMVFLPLGLRVTPMAFAASVRRATFFKPGEGLRFGPRTSDASRVEMGLSHAGTELDFVYEKPGPFDLTGSWRTNKFGEWGLRFWMVLALSSEDGVTWTWDAATETLNAAFGHRHVAVKSAAAPLLITAHDTLGALAAEYNEHGYWHLASRATSGTVMALRYHLEEMPEQHFAVAIRDDADAAREAAAGLLTDMRGHRASHLLADDAGEVEIRSTSHPVPLPKGEGTPAPHPLRKLDMPAPTGRLPGGESVGASKDSSRAGECERALSSIRDVLGWNTVFDRVNRRPYISLSRNWNQDKFGGFGVWLNDLQYAAYLAAWLDPEQAHENLAATLAGETPDGNLPCLLTAKDAWVDRNQLPIGSYLSWLTYLRNRSRPMLALAFPTLMRNHDWWWRRRDGNATGLVSFGNSPLGTGLYRGTNIGARDESSMDNSPMHDEARVDKATGTLNQWDVGLNSMLALDAEMLANIARELAREDIAVGLEAEAARLKARISADLWDETRGLFANRLWTGKFARSVSPTSFWPLLCGAASPMQARRLKEHLADPASFGGEFVLPSVGRSDPAYKDNVYWRGRIWPPLNWTVYQGLRRYGFAAEASALAAKSWALFARAWDADRLCAENYNADTGAVLDQPDTDGFYTWGALMPALAIAEVMDVSAWDGWSLTNTGADLSLGDIETPIGSARIAIGSGRLTLWQGERSVLSSDIVGTLKQLRIEPGLLALELPPGLATGGEIILHRWGGRALAVAHQAGREVAVMTRADDLALTIQPTGNEPERLLVVAAA